MNTNLNRRRAAFTIVELLVSLAIVGVLLSLLLPAIQTTRESARAIQCRNHAKQLSLAMSNHESAFGHFPGNGWGYLWIGEPARGNGPTQPGGWIYQSLAFLDQAPLRDVGSGLKGDAKLEALGELTQINLPFLRCPTRAAPIRALRKPDLIWRNALTYTDDARTDYVVNEGDFVTDTDGGPATLAEGDASNYRWIDSKNATGISFLRSKVQARDVSDGMSNTYMLGEKRVGTFDYGGDADPGYDANPLTGVDLDLNRWSNYSPGRDGSDTSGRAFGSAHSNGFHMSFCDGAVRIISHQIDLTLHRQMGNRQDGAPTSIP